MYAKPKMQSRTLWFNGLTSVAALLTAATGFIPPPVLPYVLLAQSVVSLWLRFLTVQPLR